MGATAVCRSCTDQTDNPRTGCTRCTAIYRLAARLGWRRIWCQSLACPQVSKTQQLTSTFLAKRLPHALRRCFHNLKTFWRSSVMQPLMSILPARAPPVNDAAPIYPGTSSSPNPAPKDNASAGMAAIASVAGSVSDRVMSLGQLSPNNASLPSHLYCRLRRGQRRYPPLELRGAAFDQRRRACRLPRRRCADRQALRPTGPASAAGIDVQCRNSVAS